MARRKLIWARMAPAITTLGWTGAAGAGQFVESQDLLQTFRTQMGITRGPVGLTVMRVRLTFYGQLDSSAAGSVFAGNGIYYGLRKANFQDLATREVAEIAARGPQLEPHDDWMAWGCIPPKQVFHTTANPAVVTGFSFHHEVDVRSMRKLDELDETLELMGQATSTAGTDYPFNATASVLLALP